MPAQLELDDIQSAVLRPRPTPYNAVYLIFRIDSRLDGRRWMKQLSGVVQSVAAADREPREASVSVAISFAGLRALGLSQSSLESFPPEFQQGMAARAALLHDTGESSPAHWEPPLGSNDVHIVVTVVAPDAAALERALARAQDTYATLSGVTAIWRQDCHVLPGEREAFGFRDGISQPAIDGSGVPGSNPLEVPLQPGEFVLGYPDEMNLHPAMPGPDVLGRNGSYAAFRKLHQQVALFRRYLHAHASTRHDEDALAAKMMGRWRSGAPLACSPHHDDEALGADPARRNAFLFHEDDPIGYKTPPGSHIRRMNPRDAKVAGFSRLHRMIRRGTSYGPPLPDGVMEDDGVDRGLMFAFIGAHLGRQFEFVQAEWMNDAGFYGGVPAVDPIAGAAGQEGVYDFPARPIRIRLAGLPRFVRTRGGEYCFLPGLRALRWLGEH